MGYRDVPVATVKCPGCHAEVPTGTEICPKCDSPIDVGRFAELELRVKPDLNKARTFLGLVAMLGAVGLLFRLQNGGSVVDEVATIVIFGACSLIAKKRPLGASIAAMAAFLFSEAMALAAADLGALLEGLVVKILFVVLISAGIRAGYRVRDLRGQWRKRDATLGAAVLIAATIAGFLAGFLLR
jgi:hypothetical protein